MEKTEVTRRDFLQTVSMAGVATIAAGSIFRSVATPPAPAVAKSIFVCSICGHVEFGTAPDACPICHAAKEKFDQNDALFTDTQQKFKDAVDKHIPVVHAKKKSVLITEAPSVSVETKIGSVIHPMIEAHHLRFIDCYIDDKYVSRLLLTLHSHPAGGFEISTAGSNVCIVTSCNMHGYWHAESVVK